LLITLSFLCDSIFTRFPYIPLWTILFCLLCKCISSKVNSRHSPYTIPSPQVMNVCPLIQLTPTTIHNSQSYSSVTNHVLWDSNLYLSPCQLDISTGCLTCIFLGKDSIVLVRSSG
jgi:hypothetical protein